MKRSDPKKPNSPNLEVVSNYPAGGMPADMEGAAQMERRRRPRLSLTSEQFRVAPVGKVFSVADLSPEGMAIRVLDREDLRQFPVASEVRGELNLRGARVEIAARVSNLRGELVGFQFVELSDSARETLARMLDPEVLGRELKPLPASSDEGATWYHGPSGTDLLLWHAGDGQYRRLTAFMLGSFVQWDHEEGLFTGRTQNAASPSQAWGVVRMDTTLLERDQRPDAQKLSIAKALILSSNLPQDLKQWCVRQLEIPS